MRNKRKLIIISTAGLLAVLGGGILFLYNSYRAADYWLKFQFPFWWNNLVAALDSLSLIGLGAAAPEMKKALDWLREKQETTGTWKLAYTKTGKRKPETEKERNSKLWVSLAICRIFRRIYGEAG